MQTSTSEPRANAARRFAALLLALPWIALPIVGHAEAAGSNSESAKDTAQPQPQPSAGTGCAEAVAARVQSYYESVVDFRASFRQVTRSITLGNASLGADAPSRGVVVFAKPGKMRWTYQSPVESLVVSNGEVLWIFDPAAGEAQRLPVTKDYLTGAALQFLLGDGQILKEFDVSAPSCTPDSKGLLLLKLMPRRPASYEYLGLRAKVATGEISETDLVDLFGNETSISFSEMHINLNPADETFEFEIPEGIKVIDLVAAP